MKYFPRTVLAFLLLALLLVCMALPAAAANFDTTVTITEETNQITVVVSDAAGNARILKDKKPTLTVPCSYSAAKVSFGTTVVAGPALVSDGMVTFPVEAPGTYVIQPTEAYTITFHSNGGSAVASQTVLPDTVLAQPTAPTKEGHTFDGWYTDAALTTRWTFTEKVTASMTLYAKWTDSKIGTAVTTGAGSWNPIVDTTTLDSAANAQGNDDDTVQLRLTIQDLPENSVDETEAAAIEALALGRDLKHLDMTLECSIEGGSFTDIGAANNVLLKITLDFDPTGKNNIAVFRYHADQAEVLSQGTDTGSDERFVLDQTNKKLTIYAKKFSTYAIGYTTGSDTLDTYQFIKGYNSSWAKDSSRNLVFICKAPHALLDKITINGQEISSDYAESCDDGTQITLKPAFLKDLARGKYYLELYYKNGGYAIAPFTVTRSSGISNTRDLFNMALWVSLLGLSTAGVAILAIMKKRKK